jgi:hypothetical protein
VNPDSESVYLKD